MVQKSHKRTTRTTKQIIMEERAIEYSLKASKKNFNSKKISCSEDAVDYARKFYHEDIIIYESSFIILMNTCGMAIGYAKISQGGICGTVVDIRIVAKYAIESLATSVILVHNHPSGNIKPSIEDDRITEQLSKALWLFRIKLHDSIIISESSFYSYGDNGKI